jgi:hypothetical protein
LHGVSKDARWAFVAEPSRRGQEAAPQSLIEKRKLSDSSPL